jgi:hypothetical protein
MPLISPLTLVRVNLEFQIPQAIQAAWVRSDNEKVIPTLSDVIVCTTPQYYGRISCPEPCAQFDPCVVTGAADAGGGFLGIFGF